MRYDWKECILLIVAVGVGLPADLAGYACHLVFRSG